MKKPWYDRYVSDKLWAHALLVTGLMCLSIAGANILLWITD